MVAWEGWIDPFENFIQNLGVGIKERFNFEHISEHLLKDRNRRFNIITCATAWMFKCHSSVSVIMSSHLKAVEAGEESNNSFPC